MQSGRWADTVGDLLKSGIVASILTALIAFVASLTIAFVNARAARRNARDAARREYRSNLLQPALNYTEEIAGAHQALLSSLSPHPFPEAAWTAANKPFPGLATLGLVVRTPPLAAAWKTFKEADEACHRLLGEIDRERAAHRSLTEVRARYSSAVQTLRQATIDFHAKVEEFIFSA